MSESLRTVRVQKARLVEQLTTNRDRHQRMVQEAIAGYQAQLISVLSQKLEAAKKKQPVDHALGLVVPADHSAEYDQALAIMDWEQADTVELSLEDFRRYALDEWCWKAEFAGVHSRYIGGVSPI